MTTSDQTDDAGRLQCSSWQGVHSVAWCDWTSRGWQQKQQWATAPLNVHSIQTVYPPTQYSDCQTS